MLSGRLFTRRDRCRLRSKWRRRRDSTRATIARSASVRRCLSTLSDV